MLSVTAILVIIAFALCLCNLIWGKPTLTIAVLLLSIALLVGVAVR